MRRIDWSTQPWWVRPLFAVAIGLSIGLVIGGILNVLSAFAGSIMVLIICNLGLVYAAWAMWDLRKMKRQFEYSVEQLEKTGRLPRGTLGQRRRHRSRYQL